MSRDLELWNSSAEAWIASQGEQGDSSRQFLDPFVLDLLGDITGKTIADIGCGEGRFSRLLTTKRAIVTGIEPTEKLFQTAIEKSTGETYLQEGAEKLSAENNSFEVVIFYLSMIDFEPIEPAIAEALRLLKTGGRCLVVNSASMNTASDSMWLKDETGKKIAWLVERYAEPHPISAEWAGIKIINYHRPLSHYFQAFLKAKFKLLNFLEPVPSDEQIEAEPSLANHLIMPFFNIHVWQS